MDEETLEKLRQEIIRMEKESAELFEQLGLSLHQIQDRLSDSSLYSASAFEYIQKERKALEQLLNDKIEAACAPIKKTIAGTPPAVGGHWIFVR
jgi:uncharacterized membrane-anchored protein YhcB (DUF1043 family)